MRPKDVGRYVLAVLFLVGAARRGLTVLAAIEALGAIALMVTPWKKRAAIFLMLFLLATYPVNFRAALRGEPPKLWVRTMLFCFGVSALGWSSFPDRKPKRMGSADFAE